MRRSDLTILLVSVAPLLICAAGFVYWGSALRASPEPELWERLLSPADRPTLQDVKIWATARGDFPRAQAEAVRSRLAIRAAYSFGAENEWMAFEFGGADRHYGVLIGSADARPEGFAWPIRRQWQPGVWYYAEID